MGYFIACSCRWLGPQNVCRHETHRRPWWLSWLSGPRPLCVHVMSRVNPRLDDVTCREQEDRPRPSPPQTLRRAR